MTEAQQNK